MASLVTVPDLLTEVGPLSDEDTARAEAYLSEASDLAREFGLASWTEIGGGKPAPVSVRLAVKRAARRALTEDPEGFMQETLGDWTGMRTKTGPDESGVYFTAAEEHRIAKAAGFRRTVGSIRTPSAYTGIAAGTAYVPMEGSAVPLLDEEDFTP
jgi:hypothetical protein